MNQVYLDTARLLTQAAPLVFAGGIFALKSGTAINAAIREAASRLEASGFQAHVTKADDVGETKLFVRRGTVEIKAFIPFDLDAEVKRDAALELRRDNADDTNDFRK